MIRNLLATSVVALSFALSACGSGTEVIPAAPSQAKVELLSGGAHFTWKDNSDNEDEFMLERLVEGGTFTALVSQPFNSTAYHDTTVTPGKTYMYRVAAMNTAGMSAPSNEVTIAIP